MGLRTIEAPGVEIKEIDKSGYTPSMTGSKCFVMGYSDKGTPYEPMQFTSKAAWQLYYGDPDNEAERYFYNACAEVINQNGVLNCARIPYDNNAKDKMVGFKFKVSTNTTKNPTAGDYLLNDEYKVNSHVDHDDDFEKDALKFAIDNKCLREIDAILSNGLEKDSEIERYYGEVIKKFNKTYNYDINFIRYSVGYYKVNVEESLKLSARFLKKKEAENYLKEFSSLSVAGKTAYITNQPNCIIPDMGDWIAQPLYCEYNKEALVSAEGYKGDDLDQLSAAKTEAWVQAQKCVDAGCPISAGTIVFDQENKVSSAERLSMLVNKMLTQESAKEVIDVQAVKDIKSTITLAKKEVPGEEIKSYTYADWRKRKLGDVEIDIPYIKLYTPSGELYPTEGTVKFKEYYLIKDYDDGANNEYMFNTTVSGLYEDTKLNLSASQEIKDLYEQELWTPYKGQTLGQILKKNAKEGAEPVESWKEMLTIFKKEGDIKFERVIDAYGIPREQIHSDVPYYRIADLDKNLGEYLTITQSQLPITASLDDVDAYRTGEEKVAANTFWVFDKTCATLNSIQEDQRKGKKRQMIGIFPVVTTVANALYAQSLIQPNDKEVIDYETVDSVITKSYDDSGAEGTTNSLLSTDVTVPFSQKWKNEGNTAAIDTVSREANGYFLPVQMNQRLDGIDTEHAKKIGVVVYKAYLDASEGNKVSFQPVESFVGSLDKDAKNQNTGVSTFIDKIINTQSDYIYFFSNCNASPAAKKIYNDVADFYVCKTGVTGMLGWFSNETVEEISLPSLYQGIDKCFKNIEDINERDIDIICDAGLANIAQYMKSIYEGNGAHAYDLAVVDEGGNPLIKNWTCNKASDVNAWKTVQFKYDNFCKNVRKDCMFIADGPRPLVLQGEKKIVRTSKPSNTIDANILPNVKYITGLNTNYGAGYCDWFQITDEFTGDEFWCPPSIKAMGVYINTDLNFNYWDAPAGLNRGMIQALDCAFSPTIKQAGSIYQKNWNYAINYPNDGIVLEGQKTFQVKPSAFDRVNVRRLFLRLERQTYKVARYFVYEGNTAYTRQRLVDMLDPLFYTAKVGGGIYDYKIICDESINTPNVIDNNELRVKIGIKPVKAAEFILIDFIALATGGSFSEM